MAAIRIQINACIEMTDDLNRYVSRIKKNRMRLSDLKRYSPIQFDAGEDLKRKIQETEESMEECERAMMSYLNCLCEICQRYGYVEDLLTEGRTE